MRPHTSAAVLEVLGPAPQGEALSVEFLDQLNDGFGTELGLLVGQGALRRPHDDPKVTAAELYFDLPPTEVMEVNRTVMNIWLRDRVQADDYASVTDCQEFSVKLRPEQFGNFKTLVDETLDTPELVLAMDTSLMIGDMGKSDKVGDYMFALTGRRYADHDRLILDVLKNPQAVQDLVPSFSRLSQEHREMIVTIFESGFHLAQFMQAENLAVHLEAFLQLPRKVQDFALLHSLFDIGGAAGDTEQHGSVTLDANTFTRFTHARDAIVAQDAYLDQPVETRAIQAYDTYLISRGDLLGIDARDPRGRALVRMSCMLRYNHPAEANALAQAFEDHVGSMTKTLLMGQLNETGYEPGGSLWVMYAPALLRTTVDTLRKYKKIEFGEAMGIAMTALARLVVEARSQIDVTQTPSTVLVAGSVVRSIQTDPRRLLTGRIAIEGVGKGEASAKLLPAPSFDLMQLPLLDSLDDVQLPAGETLYASLGGGVDAWLAAMLAWLKGDIGAPVVSVRGGVTEPPTNALQIAPNVYKVSAHSSLPGKRQFEDLVAKIGMSSYLIVQTGHSLEQEFRAVADHAAVKAVIGVDTGGNALEPSTLSDRNPSRDHLSLQAINQLGLTIAKTCVFGPGIDAIDTLAHQLESAQARALRLHPLADVILGLCMANQLPTDDEKRFSHTLPILVNALRGAIGVEEIPTPARQAHLRKNAWVPFGTASELMRYALFMDASAHREAIGMR